jgi:hypothetical protein
MITKIAKAGTGATLLIAIGLVVLALGAPAAGALESKDDAYAVIFATETNGSTGQIAEGWALHNWLLDHGWIDSHIKFLADSAGADGAPTVENLQGALSNVAQKSNSNSMVFIAVMDYGQNSMGDILFSASNGQVSNSQFGGWVNGVANYKKMVVEVNFRFSGGFTQSLNGPNRVVVSSHTASQSTMPNHFSLAEGLGASSIVQEAFSNQAGKITTQYPGTQTPQIYDSAGTVNLAVS